MTRAASPLTFVSLHRKAVRHGGPAIVQSQAERKIVSRVDLLNRVATIRQGMSIDRPALHKPLLLLYALGRAQQGLPRLVTYAELEAPMKDLFARFGTNRNRARPNIHQPFRWLISDGLWDVPEFASVPRTSSDDFKVTYLRANGITGGIPQSDYNMLIADEHLLHEAVQFLLWEHFPPSLHHEICTAVNLRAPLVTWGPQAIGDSPSRVRDPGFRNEVLEAYEFRCAVCDYDLQLDDHPLGLEAAHIKWHAYGGPDEIRNGLSLCGFHHNAFDRGAWRLERHAAGYCILVSTKVSGTGGALGLLQDYRGEMLRYPQEASWRPRSKYVDWHTANVFREPSRK